MSDRYGHFLKNICEKTERQFQILMAKLLKWAALLREKRGYVIAWDTKRIHTFYCFQEFF